MLICNVMIISPVRKFVRYIKANIVFPSAETLQMHHDGFELLEM